MTNTTTNVSRVDVIQAEQCVGATCSCFHKAFMIQCRHHCYQESDELLIESCLTTANSKGKSSFIRKCVDISVGLNAIPTWHAINSRRSVAAGHIRVSTYLMKSNTVVNLCDIHSRTISGQLRCEKVGPLCAGQGKFFL